MRRDESTLGGPVRLSSYSVRYEPVRSAADGSYQVLEHEAHHTAGGAEEIGAGEGSVSIKLIGFRAFSKRPVTLRVFRFCSYFLTVSRAFRHSWLRSGRASPQSVITWPC